MGEKAGDEKAGNKKVKAGIFEAVKIGTRNVGNKHNVGKE